jgi:hypothetical protein
MPAFAYGSNVGNIPPQVFEAWLVESLRTNVLFACNVNLRAPRPVGTATSSYFMPDSFTVVTNAPS